MAPKLCTSLFINQRSLFPRNCKALNNSLMCADVPLKTAFFINYLTHWDIWFSDRAAAECKCIRS